MYIFLYLLLDIWLYFFFWKSNWENYKKYIIIIFWALIPLFYIVSNAVSISILQERTYSILIDFFQFADFSGWELLVINACLLLNASDIHHRVIGHNLICTCLFSFMYFHQFINSTIWNAWTRNLAHFFIRPLLVLIFILYTKRFNVHFLS